MKRIFVFIFIIFFSISSFAQLNTWRFQNPPLEPGTLTMVQMINNHIIYACGDNRFAKSTDGGLTWSVKFLTSLFSSMSFIDSNYGMMCGDTSIFKTTDGGDSWTQLKKNTTLSLTGIVVLDKNIAVGVGMQSYSPSEDGIVTRTTDGGEHWKRAPIETIPGFISIHKLRPNFLSATGVGGLFMKSLDSGKTWRRYNIGFGNDLYKSCFTSDSVGTLIGQFGMMLHTSDGGISWKRQYLDSEIVTANLTGIDSKSSHISAIVGGYGTLLYTTNGGTNWNRGKSSTYTWHDMYDISFCDSVTGIAVGANGMILKTTDGGQTWITIRGEAFIDILYSVAFPKGDTSHGIAVGYGGAIKRTTNGGKSWDDVPTTILHEFRCVTFADSATAFIVGEYGMIFKSSDAGLTWKRINSGTGQELRSVSFANAKDGIIVGDSNTVLRTYDAGEYWTREYAVPPGDLDFLAAVCFPDLQHVFIEGNGGLYSSTDGGVNWVAPYTGKMSDRQPFPCVISFSDSLHGGVCNESVILTSDGGKSCIPAMTTLDRGKTWIHIGGLSIYCVDSIHATVVGKGGTIFHSKDGGKSWVQQESKTINNLNAVFFGTSQAGTAVGFQGTILRITTDVYPLAVHNNYSPSTLAKISIDANYPNPFSTYTTIEYNLRTSGFTTTEIYSIEGKQIAVLSEEYQNSGDHRIQFNGAGLASGTYLCRITNNRMTAETQMILHR